MILLLPLILSLFLPMDTDQQLLNILVSQENITSETASEVKLSAINSGRTIVDILIQKNLVPEDIILATKAQIDHVPYITLSGRGISPEILTFIPEPVARKYKLIPFEYDKKTDKLKIAMKEPRDLPVIEFLEQKSGKSIVPYLAKESEILETIEKEYSGTKRTQCSFQEWKTNRFPAGRRK